MSLDETTFLVLLSGESLALSLTWSTPEKAWIPGLTALPLLVQRPRTKLTYLDVQRHMHRLCPRRDVADSRFWHCHWSQAKRILATGCKLRTSKPQMHSRSLLDWCRPGCNLGWICSHLQIHTGRRHGPRQHDPCPRAARPLQTRMRTR